MRLVLSLFLAGMVSGCLRVEVVTTAPPNHKTSLERWQELPDTIEMSLGDMLSGISSRPRVSRAAFPYTRGVCRDQWPFTSGTLTYICLPDYAAERLRQCSRTATAVLRKQRYGYGGIENPLYVAVSLTGCPRPVRRSGRYR